MSKNIKLGDAIYLNNLMNNAKFKDLKDDSIRVLLEFKFQLSKISKEKDEFIIESVSNLKTDRFETLQEIPNKSKEENEEFEKLVQDIDKTINSVVNQYLLKDISIDVQNLESSEFFLFCKINDFNIQSTEFLYNLLVL